MLLPQEYLLLYPSFSLQQQQEQQHHQSDTHLDSYSETENLTSDPFLILLHHKSKHAEGRQPVNLKQLQPYPAKMSTPKKVAVRRAKLLPSIKKFNKRADTVAETALFNSIREVGDARMRAARQALAMNEKSIGVYYIGCTELCCAYEACS